MDKRQLTTKVKPSGQTQFGPTHDHWWSTSKHLRTYNNGDVSMKQSVDLEQHNWYKHNKILVL